jgi:uncharacterized membrane protein
LIDLAFEQLRQYGKTDMAIALRLLRVLADVASVTRDRAALDLAGWEDNDIFAHT